MKNSRGATSDSLAEAIYLHFPPNISDLEGKVLTLIDASIQDPTQRQALKGVFRQTIWSWAVDTNMADMYDISLKKSTKDNIIGAL